MSRTLGTNSAFGRSLDSVGWSLFFMWVGVALLWGFSWTLSLIGTAVIIIAVQSMLFFRGERPDVFMAALGVVLLVGAVGNVYGSPWSLFPALLIVVGIAMLADTLRRRPVDKSGAIDGAAENRPI